MRQVIRMAAEVDSIDGNPHGFDGLAINRHGVVVVRNEPTGNLRRIDWLMARADGVELFVQLHLDTPAADQAHEQCEKNEVDEPKTCRMAENSTNRSEHL